MRGNVIYIALLLFVAQGAWAKIVHDYYPDTSVKDKVEGPWTFDSVNNMATGRTKTGRSFNSLDHTAWQPVDGTYLWNDKDGIGFTFEGPASEDTYYGIYSTYFHHETLPPYTRRQLTWEFSLLGDSDDRYDQGIAVYVHDNMDTLKEMQVDFTDNQSWSGPKPRALHFLRTTKPDQKLESPKSSYCFDFDNRNGNDTIVKSWYLLMTHVMSSDGDYHTHQWGSFKNASMVWDTLYYKHVSFEANGGAGIMKTCEIENSGNLTANTFTRAGYTFVGWATAKDGAVVYADGEAITATAENKGPVTLYATWRPTTATVIGRIDAIGDVVCTAECKARIDAARASYEALDDKSGVTNYSTLTAAEANYEAVKNAVTKIDAIGEVCYTEECKAKIDDAREAYEALTKEQKALVINYSTLTDTEAQYAILGTIAKIDAIGTVEYTPVSKVLIDAARAAYSALTAGEMTQVTNYATLLAAEAAYADLCKTQVQFVDKEDAELSSQRKSIAYPDLPAGASKWQAIKKNVSADSTIVIKAVK